MDDTSEIIPSDQCEEHPEDEEICERSRRRAMVSGEQFEIVAHTIVSFESYLEDTVRGNDAVIARRQAIRADDFEVPDFANRTSRHAPARDGRQMPAVSPQGRPPGFGSRSSPASRTNTGGQRTPQKSQQQFPRPEYPGKRSSSRLRQGLQTVGGPSKDHSRFPSHGSTFQDNARRRQSTHQRGDFGKRALCDEESEADQEDGLGPEENMYDDYENFSDGRGYGQ